MNKLKKLTPVFVITILSYLIFSFVLFDINAKNWAEGERVAFIVATLGSIVIYNLSGYADITENIKPK